MTTVLTNAQVVTPDRVFAGTVVLEGATIAAVDDGPTRAPGADDLEGDYLIPGMIDLHTDALEKHTMPRPHVKFDTALATVAHDAQTTTAGITTVYESLGAGGTVAHPERDETLMPMLEGLLRTQQAKMLRGEHLVQLRCEITHPNVLEYFEQAVSHPLVRLISINDHAPGHRQYPDVEYYRVKHMRNYGITAAEMDVLVARMVEQSQKHGPARRSAIVERCHARSIPLASHDDRTREEVDLAIREGMAIAEFPISCDAAEHARDHGIQVLSGAPNLVRGSSHHPGNLATKDLARRRLVDILVSDYVPISLLRGALKLTEPEIGWSLPDAVRTVTANPARAAGLTDRGEIVVGKRADLVQVSVIDGLPIVRRVWVRGKRVA
jgi:alpha-D-ribose 1-methylphosphonate 5-triphosphate diphosphatase